MFKAIRAQVAMDDDGTIVESAGRYAMRCRSGNWISEIEVDNAKLTGIYVSTLTTRTKDGRPVTLNATECNAILEKIKAGMTCLGIDYELV